MDESQLVCSFQCHDHLQSRGANQLPVDIDSIWTHLGNVELGEFFVEGVALD